MSVSITLLGLAYIKGYTIRDEIEALKWFRRSAELNNVYAQYYLGLCYEGGIGGAVPSDKEAYNWYLISAQQNNAQAQNKLGNFYMKGRRGIEKNYAKAVEWYTKAAEQGEESALYSLGVCYEYGHGVRIDEEQAFNLYKKAAEKENLE